MTTTDLAAANPLIPNGTFFVELIIFLIVLFVMLRFVAPPIRDALRQREEMIHKTAEDSQQASERLTAAERRHEEALAEARNESGRIRDEARAEGQQLLNGMRDRAREEVDRIQRDGAEALAAQRDRALGDLRPRIGSLSVTLAGRIVGEDLSGDPDRDTTVARFLDEHRDELAGQRGGQPSGTGGG